jgi:hypothetical protein
MRSEQEEGVTNNNPTNIGNQKPEKLENQKTNKFW